MPCLIPWIKWQVALSRLQTTEYNSRPGPHFTRRSYSTSILHCEFSFISSVYLFLSTWNFGSRFKWSGPHFSFSVFKMARNEHTVKEIENSRTWSETPVIMSLCLLSECPKLSVYRSINIKANERTKMFTTLAQSSLACIALIWKLVWEIKEAF